MQLGTLKKNTMNSKILVDSKLNDILIKFFDSEIIAMFLGNLFDTFL